MAVVIRESTAAACLLAAAGFSHADPDKEQHNDDTQFTKALGNVSLSSAAHYKVDFEDPKGNRKREQESFLIMSLPLRGSSTTSVWQQPTVVSCSQSKSTSREEDSRSTLPTTPPSMQ